MIIFHVFKFDNYNAGLGDFLRGSLALSQVKDSELVFDFDGSSLSKFFSNSRSSVGLDKKAFYNNENNLWDYIEINKKNNCNIAVGTNYFPVRQIENENRKKVIENLKFNQETQNKFDALIKSLPSQYIVLHIRIGDENNQLFSPPNVLETVEASYKELLSVFKKIDRILVKRNLNKKTVVLSDRLAMKKIFAEHGYYTSDALPVHTSAKVFKLEDIENTLLDFYILSKSSHIIQYSNYIWGSGFSQSAAVLYNISSERIGPYGAKVYPMLKNTVFNIETSKIVKWLTESYFFPRYALSRSLSLKDQLHHYMNCIHETSRYYKKLIIGLSFVYCAFLLIVLKAWLHATVLTLYIIQRTREELSSRSIYGKMTPRGQYPRL